MGPTEGADRVWRQDFTVRSFESDLRMRISIQSVCGYLQEAAGNSADSLGFGLRDVTERSLVWVLARLLLRMREYPGWGSTITVQSWPVGLRTLFALRDFRLLSGSRTIGEATSAWLLIDSRTRRPVRPETQFDWSVKTHDERSIPITLEKLPGFTPGEGEEGEQLRVRYSDLDNAGHANNARYVEWLLDGIPLEVRRDSLLSELEINFLAEASYGDRLVSRSREVSPGTCAHGIWRGGQEIARGRSVWK